MTRTAANPPWRRDRSRPAFPDFPAASRSRLEKNPHLLALRKMPPELIVRVLRKLMYGFEDESRDA